MIILKKKITIVSFLPLGSESEILTRLIKAENFWEPLESLVSSAAREILIMMIIKQVILKNRVPPLGDSFGSSKMER